MTETRRCSRCGAPFLNVAHGDLCPGCLLKLGLHAAEAGGEPTRTFSPSVGEAGQQSPHRPRLLDDARFGPYRIVRLLGAGGMGEVYEAEHMDEGRRVALKVLSRALDSARDRDRFLREGRLAAAISDPHTVYVFGTDEIEGIPVIAMELAPGGTLKDRTRDTGPLRPPDAVDAILQVIAGLEAAYAAGILHRDVKPSNCFTARDGTVKVGDFGLSISTLAREATLTASGAIQGTPQFASPEQLRGEPLDVRSDIYSVGATLFYLLTGAPPFDDRELLPLVTRIATEAAPSPRVANRAVPRGLARVILRCLAKSAGSRFADYAALRTALEPYGFRSATPATLWRRVVAFELDVMPFGMGVVMGILMAGDLTFLDTRPRGVRGVIPYLLVLLYFGITESRWGGSVGKRLLGLRVVRSDGHAPGWRRGAIRTGVFFGVLWLKEFAQLFQPGRSPLPTNAQEPSSLAFFLAYVFPLELLIPCGSLLLLFGMQRRRNGYAGLHDWLSGTRIVRMVAAADGARIGRPTAGSPPSLAGAVRVGPHVALDRIDVVPESGIVVRGYDPQLRRALWLHVRPPGSEPVDAARRDCDRPTRLRWIGGQRNVREAWDAYETVDGFSLNAQGACPRQPASIRRWLVDLITEIDEGLRDGTLPPLSIDRVWIGHDGRARLLDWSVPAANAGTSATRPLDDSASRLGQAQQLLLEVIGLARRPDSPLPVRMTAFVDRLHAHDFKDVRELLHASRVLSEGPAQVTRTTRVAHLALCCVIPALIAADQGVPLVRDDGPVIAAVARLAWLSSQDSGALIVSLERLERLDMAWFRTAFHNDLDLASESPQLRNMRIYVSSRFGAALRDPRIGKHFSAVGLGGLWTAGLKAAAAHPHPTAADRAQAENSLRADVLADLDGKFTYAIRLACRDFTYILVSAVGAVSFVLPLWVVPICLFSALVFGGGLGFRWCGLAVVTGDGRPVSMARGVLRATVAIGPMLVALIVFLPEIAEWAGLQSPLLGRFGFATNFHVFGLIPVSDVVGAAALFICALGAAYAARHPERGLQDRLAGTWLVPQ